MAFTHSARVDLDAVDTASELVPVVGVEDDLRWQPAVGAQDRHLAADLVVGGVPPGRAPECGREARPFRSAIPAGAERGVLVFVGDREDAGEQDVSAGFSVRCPGFLTGVVALRSADHERAVVVRPVLSSFDGLVVVVWALLARLVPDDA